MEEKNLQESVERLVATYTALKEKVEEVIEQLSKKY